MSLSPSFRFLSLYLDLSNLSHTTALAFAFTHTFDLTLALVLAHALALPSLAHHKRTLLNNALLQRIPEKTKVYHSRKVLLEF